MSAAILLLTLAACFPQLELSDGTADGGGVGGDDGGGDDGGGDDGGGDDGGGDDGGDDGTTVSAPSLSSAGPAHGSNAGGRGVTIRGADLGDTARVWFGDREATVVSSDDDLIEVEAPASPGVVGPVTIRVQTEGGEDSLAEAFQYWEDASGKAVTVLRARAIEGWDGSGWWTSFQALGWNTTPMDVWSTDTQAGLSSCTASYSISAAETPPASMAIDGDLGRLALDPLPDSAGMFLEANSPGVLDLEGTRHDVSLGGGGAWPSYDVADGIAFPDSLELYSPNPDDYESQDIDEFAVAWSASGADRIQVGFFDASSDALVLCTLSDTGEFSVPADTYTGFVPSESAWWGEAWVMQVVVLAYKDTASVLDFNNGELRAQGGIGYATWVRVEDSWL
jgi:hypothetical protein